MFRISLLAFGFLVFFLAVSAEESQDQDLSNIVSDLASLRRDVRSPGVSTKKKSKKGEKKARRKKKKGPSSKRRTAKKNSKRPKKKSGSNQNSGKKNIQRKRKSKKPKSKRKSKKKPQKIKIAKKNNRRRTKPRKCNRQTGADDDTCSTNIETAMDYEGKQIKNFNNQKKRIEDFDKLMKNKGGKKENFQNTTTYMKEALGSDNSCNGTTNETDAQTAVSTHTTLSNCSTSVDAGCSIPSNTYNTTELASCETSFTAVTTKNAECYKLTTATSPELSAACTCWAAAATLVETTKALKCSAVSSYQSMTALKKTCLSKFSECKKAEDASVGLIQVCNGRTTPSTASVPSPAPAPSAPSPAVSPSTAAPVPTPSADPVTTTAAAAPTTSTAAASQTTTTAAAAPTTTAAAATDDEIVTRVKGYIDAGSCGSISANSNCGSSASSYYKEITYNSKRVIISSQVPDHNAEQDAITSNPNTRCERFQYIQLPLTPTKGSSTAATGLGTVGLAVTGGAFFNHLSNPDGSLAMPNEGTSLDSCFGHSAPGGAYHYHANINCTNAGAATGANDPDKCVLIGYMADGFPVYGFCKDSSGKQMTSCYSLNSGVTTVSVTTAAGTVSGIGSSSNDYTYDTDAFTAGTCNLDKASGAIHPTTNSYSYFMTTEYPWTPIELFGSEGAQVYCSAA